MDHPVQRPLPAGARRPAGPALPAVGAAPAEDWAAAAHDPAEVLLRLAGRAGDQGAEKEVHAPVQVVPGCVQGEKINYLSREKEKQHKTT